MKFPFFSGCFIMRINNKHYMIKRNYLMTVVLALGSMCPVMAENTSETMVNIQQQSGYTVKGVVVDEKGEPIIGAYVIDTSSDKNGAVTDIDGNFTITLKSEKSSLKISYVGYQSQTVKPQRGKTLTITMVQDDKTLDDVIVVAFGEQKRSSFTGSAAVVGSKELEKKQLTNVLSGLQGEAAGVQMVNNSGDPTATPSIRIRGFSSINAGKDPLIIVDGSPYDGGWNNLNPNDVESVTVLKDAASNALYGARGANGVIMVTTKKGKSGNATITLDAKWGSNARLNRDYKTIDDPAQYLEVYYKGLYNYYLNEKGMSPYDAQVKANNILCGDTAEGGLGYPVYTVPEGEYLIGENGRLNPNASLGARVYNNGEVYTLMPDDWKKEAFRVGLRQEYNLNANGGTDAFQFYGSLGYLKNEGYAYNTDFERYSGRLKATYQAKKWLKLGGNIQFARSQEHSVGTGDSSIFYMVNSLAPIYPVYIRDASGKIMTDQNGLMYDYGDANTIGLYRPVIPQANPIQENAVSYDDYHNTTFTMSGFADINILQNLKLTVNGTVTSNNGVGTYSPQNFYGFGILAYPTGYISRYQSQTYSYNFQQILNYSQAFGKHNMSLMGGHEYYNYFYDSVSGSRTGMASFYENQTLSGAIKVDNASDSQDSYNNEGFFFRGQYDYDGKYFGSTSLRRDASSRFHPSHRWGTFYSFGGAWIMTKESWMEGLTWLNMLKLKASFGQQGNDNIGNYRYVDTYDIGSNNGELAISFKSKGNENITWETNNNFNCGFEFEVLNSRLSGGVEYFYRKTTDMLSVVYGSYSSGIHSVWNNIGDMANSGIEIELKGQVIRTKDFEWSVNFNATHYKNEVLKISEALKNTTKEGHPGYTSGDKYYGEGLPLYTWYINRYAGINEEGKSTWYYTDSDGNLKTTDVYGNADYYLCGDVHPDLYGGFGTSLNYKGFDLSIQCTYSLGGKAYDYGYSGLVCCPTSALGGNAIHKDVLDAWSVENPTSTMHRWQYGDANSTGMSDRFLVDASYLTLQNINVGYNFPSKWVKKIGLTGLRVYGAGDNLWYWSCRMGFDPRGSFTGETATANYSSSRTLSVGVNVKF